MLVLCIMFFFYFVLHADYSRFFFYAFNYFHFKNQFSAHVPYRSLHPNQKTDL